MADQNTSVHAEQAGRGRMAAVFVGMGLAFAVGAVVAMMLYANIARRKWEGERTALRIVDLDETTVDPAVWGQNYPRQYDGYIRTAQNAPARFRWSEGISPGVAAEVDARQAFGGGEGGAAGDAVRPEMTKAVGKGNVETVHTTTPDGKAESKLVADPKLLTIFNGYAFAIDYRERRGHAYMLFDQQETQRVKQRPQPGACLNCHASTSVAYREAGIKAGAPGHNKEPLTSENGLKQLYAGWQALNHLPYHEAAQHVSHPVTCLDCHDPKTMNLRITRPAFLEGIAAFAAGDVSSDSISRIFPSVHEWRKGDRKAKYDPNVLATRQEMRSMTCAQCHVEYAFHGKDKTLTFPWVGGLKAEQMEAFYDKLDFSDWTHADSGAKVLKAQHPEFELWSQGIHARSGVSCADCHMPYKRDGAMKYSDHQVQTPLAHVNLSCQVCHNYTESEILSRVDEIQKRQKAHLDRAETAVVELIRAIAEAKGAGATDEQLASARQLQRKAQWRADLMNAENSMGFHAPEEALRIVGEAIDYARQGTTEVAKLRGGLTPAQALQPRR